MSHEQESNKLIGMIGLARRAGKLTFGSDAVVCDIEKNKAMAVLLSNDASLRTLGRIKDCCGQNGVKYALLPFSKTQLGRAIGRDDVAVVSIADKSFADRILCLCAGANDARNGQIDSGG